LPARRQAIPRPGGGPAVSVAVASGHRCTRLVRPGV